MKDILNVKNNYVTKEEILSYSGINLDLELPNDDDSSNKANRFIHRVEMFILDIISHYEKQELNDYNLPYLKLAIIEQVMYNLINNDNKLSVNSKMLLRKGGFLNIRRGG